MTIAAADPQPGTGTLAESLKSLCEGYRQTKQLLNKQITAVIGNDLHKLNELIREQTEAYDDLQNSEEQFRSQLVQLFQKYYPDHEHPSLKKVIDAVEGPAAELDDLRENLYTEIDKTEKIRSALVQLLEFASEYNRDTIATLSNLTGGKAESYNPEGKVERGESASIGLNRKI
ncbi:flagellar export chaperone FlgN [Rhodohalobacter mucosus]|nr:flagellar export chaperone FlgN [Rhodohalobacter mucosus]